MTGEFTRLITKSNVNVRTRTGNEKKTTYVNSHVTSTSTKKVHVNNFFFFFKQPILIFFKATSVGLISIRCVFISENLSVNVKPPNRAANTRSTQLFPLATPQLNVFSKWVELKHCKSLYETPKTTYRWHITSYDGPWFAPFNVYASWSLAG